MRQRKEYKLFTSGETRAVPLMLAVCLLASVAMPASTLAFRADASSPGEAEAGGLAPGEYLWNSSLAPSGPMTMIVDLRKQRAYVYRDGVRIGISTISSGKPGYETPTGTFTVLKKERNHHSNKYDDAPMPYMQRLTWSGLALHAGRVRSYPASHGCVRLPHGFAAALYGEATRGMKVVITDQAPGEEINTVPGGESAPVDIAIAGADASR